MTITTTHQHTCDLCGENVGEPERHTGPAGSPRPVPAVAGATFRRSGRASYQTLDLCKACAAPLEEALIERIVVLQAEGRIRSAA